MNTTAIYLTVEHEQFRQEVRNFLNEHILPHLEQWEANKYIPRTAWKLLADFGLLGLHYPKALGGSEKDLFFSIVLLEELGRTGYAGFRTAIAVHAYMATYYLLHAGSTELKFKYLAPAISAEKISALGISEASAGSDLSYMQTTAVIDGEHYVINGNKKYIINGETCDFIIIAAKTANNAATKRGATGVSMLVIDTDSAGISCTKLANIGMYCANVAEMQFENVRIPVTNLIGRANQGFLYLMQCLQLERLASAALAVGSIAHCIDLTWQYMSERRIYNNTLNKLQVLRHQMAEHMTEWLAARQLTYHAAWAYAQQQQLPIVECSMAKLKATELAQRVIRDCLQFHGARGYETSSAIARLYRDAPVATIGAGVSELMRDIIAQLALDDSKE